MTGLTARRFGLAARGELRVGAAADLTLFDAAQVLDGATFDDPIAAPRASAGCWSTAVWRWPTGSRPTTARARCLRRVRA
jgi:N-acyl-D-amino-acid deacylase